MTTPQQPQDALNTQIRTLAAQLNKPTPMAVSYIKGVVTAVAPNANPPSCSVQINGDTSQDIDGVLYFDYYFPVIGDVVVIASQSGSASQGSDIVIMGQLQDSAGGAARGWVTPTLNTGFTNNANSMGNVQYRLINSHGEFMMQWRGGFGLTSSSTSLLHTPLVAPFKPSVPRYQTARRDSGGGALNDIGIDFNPDGTVTLEGYDPLPHIAVHPTLSYNGAQNTTIGNGGGTTSDGGHSHGTSVSSSGSITSQSGTVSGGASTGTAHTHTIGHSHGVGVSVGVSVNGVGNHSHGEGDHDHSIGNHSHSLTLSVTSGGNPAWISLSGVQYFI